MKRLLYIALPLLLALAMIIPLRKARINPDLNDYLPEKVPARQNLARLEAVFGKYEPLLLILETGDVLAPAALERIQNLSRELNGMSEFKQIVSLFDAKNIRSEDGAMIVDPVVKALPANDEERERLREEIRANDLAFGLVVSEDFRYALFIANPAEGVSDDDAVALLEDLLEKYPGPEKAYLNGTPYLKTEIQARALQDLSLLLPAGLLLMVVFLFFSFREKRGVALPLAVVLLSIMLSMGLMPLFGWELSVMSVLVPIMMIAVANNYGVHVIARYQELNAARPDLSMSGIVREALGHLRKPIVFTALTTIVGVLGLATHIMVPAVQMGIVSAIGIGFALLLSLTFLPAILSLLPKGKPRVAHASRLEALLARLGRLSAQRPGAVALVFMVAMVVMGLGIFRLKVNLDHDNILPPKHPLRVSTKIADRYFGGAKTATLMWEGDLKDPALLRRMEARERELEALPEVGRAVSLATMIRKMSEALNDPGEEGYGQIPSSRDAVAQYLELYAMSGEPEDLEQFVDFDYERGAMTVQFHAGNGGIYQKLEAIVAEEPNCTLLAGHALMEKELSASIVRGQTWSLLFAAGAIMLLLWLIFRSLSAGLMGSLPLVFALVCNFGLMGWMGIRLDIATSLLSSIAIGIGVDYAIHLIWRLRAEREAGLPLEEAIPKTLQTTGRGIAVNAFSVMLGFSALFLSALTLLKAFAFLIIFSLLLCLVCALALIPALCVLWRPQFLEKHP
jgi:uncharacterized protein